MITLKQWLEKPLSWSSYSSFLYDKERWYKNYILEEKETSKELEFGSMIDLKIQNDPTFLPTLPRYEHMQYKMKVKLKDIELVGIPDGLDLTNKKQLADYKTGKVKWDQKRANETGQLTFYLLLIYITHKIKPEEFDCFIHWLPTVENGDFTITFKKEGEIKTFKTKRTLQDILVFGGQLLKIHKEMELFIKSK